MNGAAAQVCIHGTTKAHNHTVLDFWTRETLRLCCASLIRKEQAGKSGDSLEYSCLTPVETGHAFLNVGVILFGH